VSQPLRKVVQTFATTIQRRAPRRVTAPCALARGGALP
jgi:hypothetical protein